MASTESTSSMGTGCRPSRRNSIRPRSVASRFDWSSMSLLYSWKHLEVAGAAGMLQLVDGLGTEQMVLALLAPLILPAGVERLAVDRRSP